MARKNLLPSYLNAPAWSTLCDAIDAVFKETIDTPTNNLGKLREVWHFNATTDEKVNNAELIQSSDLDIFERSILILQLNTLGYNLRSPEGLTDEQLLRLVRNMATYWYSKGKQDLANYLGYVLDSDVSMYKMWTQDYVNFYPEGDPMIGTPIYEGGQWYPTTHTTVEVDILTLPGDLKLEVFADIFTDMANYPLVLSYIISAAQVYISSSLGDFIPVAVAKLDQDMDIIGNFDLVSSDYSIPNGGGRFTPVAHTPIPGDVLYIEPPPPVTTLPIVNFSASATFGWAPFSVTFQDFTANKPISWAWGFEGTGTVDSIEQNPTHVYTVPGPHTVTLTATNTIGESSATKVDFIILGYSPIANFTASTLYGQVPFQVNFTDTSTRIPETWLWDFGDGATSTLQNPSHTYTEIGNHTVSLTVTNPQGTDTVTQDVLAVIPVPVPSFTATPSSGPYPLDVQFMDNSTGIIDSWLWNFGYGLDSTEQNPRHTFSIAGEYIVTLTTTNSTGSTSVQRPISSLVHAPTADFTPNPPIVVTGAPVTFNGTTTEAVANWMWDFGDGITSTDPSPVHIYSNVGSYNVTLTTSNAVGSATHSVVGAVIAYAPMVADFGMTVVDSTTVTFTDTTTGSPAAWSWDFGDGGADTTQNPTHSYPDLTNPHSVTLATNNAYTSSLITKSTPVGIPITPLTYDFSPYTWTGPSYVDPDTGLPYYQWTGSGYPLAHNSRWKGTNATYQYQVGTPSVHNVYVGGVQSTPGYPITNTGALPQTVTISLLTFIYAWTTVMTQVIRVEDNVVVYSRSDTGPYQFGNRSFSFTDVLPANSTRNYRIQMYDIWNGDYDYSSGAAGVYHMSFAFSSF